MTLIGTNSVMRQALISILKAQRQKMSKAERQRRSKPARWLYPWAQEQHYAAAIRNWMRPMREYVQNFLATHSESLLHGDSANAVVRNDATPGKTFKLMVNSLNGWVGKYAPEKPADAPYSEIFSSPIYIGLGNIADSTFDFNGKQYDKSAKHTLGIEFPSDEYWWKDARSTWIDQNYTLIQTDLKKYIAQVNTLTEKAVMSGWSVGVLKKEIQTMDGKMKEGRANFIARDQIGKLNGQITQARMESVGLSMYQWSTSGDERVRGSHALLDDALCRWDDSKVYSQDGGKTWKPRPAGAVLLHPGADFQCRCVALAYWDEIVDEADAKIAEYEELDTLSAKNIAATPKTTQPAATPAPPAKKFVTQKMLQAQAADLEKQMKAIDLAKATPSDKRLFNDLKAKKASIEAEIEKKKVMAQKNQLSKKVKKLEKEIQGIQVKTYSGIWKDDVTTADYADKAAGIQAKKDYFAAKLSSDGLSESDKAKFTLFLKDLDEFEAEGRRYANIQSAMKDAKGQLTSLRKGGIIDDSPYTQQRKDAAIWAKTPKVADAALRDVCGKVWRGASQEERQAVFTYTTGPGGFNRPLRGLDQNRVFKGVGKVDLNAEGRGTAIKKMTAIIGRSKYDHDIWLQRGIETAEGAGNFLGITSDNLRHWSQAQLSSLIGKEVVDEGFVSCGSARGQGFRGYLFNIYCPKGTKMLYAEPFSDYGQGDGLKWDGVSKQSSFGHEDETIIQRGTTFRVIKVEKQGTDIYFDVEVVRQI